MPTSLAEAVLRYTDERGGAPGLFSTAIDGLSLVRLSRETAPVPVLYRPSLCVVAQGEKRVSVGDVVFRCGVGEALLVGVEVSALSAITGTCEAEPYLSIDVDLDVPMLRKVAEEVGVTPEPSRTPEPGVVVISVGVQLADALLRLVGLLWTPEAVPILHPSVIHEIAYWLLTGNTGAQVSRLALPDAPAQRIAGAIRALREDLARPVRVQDLAADAGMSLSSFYEHFRRVTSTTPIQYQKRLRLLEARRRMVSEGSSVTEASAGVGYVSASQFGREYARLFGSPPRRDVIGLRDAPSQETI